MLRQKYIKSFQHERSISSAYDFIQLGDFEKALNELATLIKRISDRPESSMQFMPSQAVDACLVKLASEWRKVNTSTAELKCESHCDILILTSALFNQGGHTREIEDLISNLGESKKVALALGFKKSKMDARLMNGLFSKVEGFAHNLSSNLARLEWMVQRIEHLNPKVLFVSPSETDTALFVAIAAARMSGKLILNLNLDHNVSPGLFIPRIDSILTKRPYIYLLLKYDYKLIDKTVYVPFSRNPSVDRQQLKISMGFDQEIVSASCTSVTYKIENNYIYQFPDVIGDLICRAGIKHVHIGAISDLAKKKIYQKLLNNGFDSSYFIHIPFAARLSDVFIKYGVNVLIQTFPIGGGLVAVEAMECGLVVVNHRCYSTKLYNLADFCYEGAPIWSEPEELIRLIQNMQQHEIKSQREKSRAHYQKYNIPGGNEKLLTDDKYQGYHFDESMYKSLFDYPMDVFRIKANLGLESLIKKRRRRPFFTRLQRIPMKIKRLFS